MCGKMVRVQECKINNFVTIRSLKDVVKVMKLEVPNSGTNLHCFNLELSILFNIINYI